MAPIPPTKNKPLSKPSHPLSNPYKTAHRISKAPVKRAKRISKHTALLSRINTNHPNTHAVAKPSNRRRPSKKLVTTLDSLADALPLHTSTANDNDNQEAQHAHTSRSHIQDQKIVHKSLKTRPGAGKKKEKLVAMERERFAKNLAEMAKGSGNTGANGGGGGMVVEGEQEMEEGKAGSADRWAAIRGFIRGRIERSGAGERETVMGKK